MVTVIVGGRHLPLLVSRCDEEEDVNSERLPLCRSSFWLGAGGREENETLSVCEPTGAILVLLSPPPSLSPPRVCSWLDCSGGK